MKSEYMNVYDFDKTIYNGDSMIDFYFYCIKRYPLLMRYLPKQAGGLVQYLRGQITKTVFKEKFYSFLCGITNIESVVNEFWLLNEGKINQWYEDQKGVNDVIISASPEFLLCPICYKLGIRYVVASRVDGKTGKYYGVNCYGEEKLKRLFESFPHIVVNEFYSDSLSDFPIAQIAIRSYLVKHKKRIPWDAQK